MISVAEGAQRLFARGPHRLRVPEPEPQPARPKMLIEGAGLATPSGTARPVAKPLVLPPRPVAPKLPAPAQLAAMVRVAPVVQRAQVEPVELQVMRERCRAILAQLRAEAAERHVAPLPPVPHFAPVALLPVRLTPPVLPKPARRALPASAGGVAVFM